MRARGVNSHAICADTAAFREDLLQLVERFPGVPLERIARDLGGGITARDVETFLDLARRRRRRLNEQARRSHW